MSTDETQTRQSVDDCWNRIGVWGDHECPELQKVGHCRNCPVYSNAAAQLLDRPLPSGYMQEWATHYASTKSTDKLDTDSLLIFRIGSEWLALPSTVLEEVGAKRPVHGLPHRRAGAVLGVANVRGQLLVCMSLATVLGIETSSKAPAGKLAVSERFLVVAHEGTRLVLPVEEVAGVERFNPEKLLPTPATLARAKATHTKGVLDWKNKSVGLLDEGLLFKTLGGSFA